MKNAPQTRQGRWIKRKDLKNILVTKPVHKELKKQSQEQPKRISMWKFTDDLLRKVLGL